MEIPWIAAAFALGLAVRAIGLPTLVGYLAAGFAMRAAGVEGGEVLEHAAHLGVLLLLFSVGLKLQLASLVRVEVLAGGLGHLALATAAGAAMLLAATALAPDTALVLGAAAAFSSTVMAAKILEDKAELRTFHGRTAIGILIVQDLVAVGLLSVSGGGTPSPWALLWLGLPLLRAAIARLLSLSGHGELLLLYGMLLALGLGGAGFAWSGLSAELGALVLGTLLAGHPRTTELASALWGVKELFLVGFFLSIGMAGLPGLRELVLAGLLLLTLPAKMALYFGALLVCRLRARTAFLAALALGSYSEFGLIVAQLAAQQGWLSETWLVALAVAVAVSFALTAPLNAASHALFARFEERLERFQSARRHPDDEPISLGDAQLLVFGMGRIGSAAYDHLLEQGARVVGLDSDPVNVASLRQEGRRVEYGDAEDPDLWHRLQLGGVSGVLLALPDLEAKQRAAEALRTRGYPGLVAATTAFPEEEAALKAVGVGLTFNHYDRAGESFARRSWERLRPG